MLIISVICGIVKWKYSFLNSTIYLTFLLTMLYFIDTKNNIVHSACTIIIALSINYILYFIAICISYIPNALMQINNKYINFAIIIFLYSILMYLFFKIKKFKQGFSFLQRNSKNDYFDILILNISIIILFSIIILSNYNEILVDRIFWGFIIFAIIMFITIQKSLQLYYKQKLLIQDLNETKKELEEKNKEIEQLEKENLNFSKTSHSIAHKQKALEHKLNELMLKNEIAEEIDIKERIDSIAKEISKETSAVELSKTDISEIDDMLKYMQAECIKNKIDFQLKLSGNIHHMINHYVARENLEILLADHIKNAIIAINYSENTNKSILVRLGKINGVYSLYVYDSGIEFQIETLLNLGKKPSTTHSDNGGTGMGFMNTFDTLNKYKASMIINEYSKPKEEDFTKLIMIKFDEKNEFKICSYRAEEIKNKDNKKSLNIEKI